MIARTKQIFSSEPRARAFLIAYAQSSIGTWAGVAALIVLAYARLHSGWAIPLVLLADFVPAMLIGPLLGAAIDRWPRRRAAIAADVVRALAFLGIALIGDFWATVAFALVAGTGTAVFTPAALAALPDLVESRRVPAMTALFGTANDLGRIVGPLLAAVSFAWIGATGVIAFDAATFALSALALAFIPFGGAAAAPASRSLMRETREGLSVVTGLPVVRVVLWATSAVAVFAAMMNVSELLLARSLGAGAAGYSLIVTAFGCGVVIGSWVGGRDATPRQLRTRYHLAILIVGLALLCAGVTPLFVLTLPAFAIAGFANGLFIVHQRLLYHALVPESLKGRAFSALNTVSAWGFAASFLAGGALLELTSPAGLIEIAGAGCLCVWVLTVVALQHDAAASAPRYWTEPSSPSGAEEASTVRTASA